MSFSRTKSTVATWRRSHLSLQANCTFRLNSNDLIQSLNFHYWLILPDVRIICTTFRHLKYSNFYSARQGQFVMGYTTGSQLMQPDWLVKSLKKLRKQEELNLSPPYWRIKAHNVPVKLNIQRENHSVPWLYYVGGGGIQCSFPYHTLFHLNPSDNCSVRHTSDSYWCNFHRHTWTRPLCTWL